MKRTVARVLSALSILVATLFVAGTAHADRPRPWQMMMQDPASPIADDLQWLHFWVLVLITGIVAFVLALLVYVCWRFRAGRNPVPSRTTHHAVLEVAWTLIPVIILFCLAIPSLRLLYFEEEIPKSDLTLKVQGIQWYWHYSYPDNGDFGFDSTLLDEKKLTDPTLRLLDVDNEVVLPVGETIRIQLTGQDVMHSWFIPSLAVQKYVVPGHLNEEWMEIEREGTYFGECNQICGVNHADMPIKIRAVSKEEFAKWVEQAKTKFAREDGAPPTHQLASAAGQAGGSDRASPHPEAAQQ